MVFRSRNGCKRYQFETDVGPQDSVEIGVPQQAARVVLVFVAALCEGGYDERDSR